MRHIAVYFLEERLDFLFQTALSVSQCPEPEDPSVKPGLRPCYTPLHHVCCVSLWFHPCSLCKTLNPGSHTHTSHRALFSHTWTTTHLSINRLDCQGHLCGPLLSFRAQTLITCSFSSHSQIWIHLLHFFNFLLFLLSFLFTPSLPLCFLLIFPPPSSQFFHFFPSFTLPHIVLFSHWWAVQGATGPCAGLKD